MSGPGQDASTEEAGDNRDRARRSVLTPPAKVVAIPARRTVTPAVPPARPATGGPQASPAPTAPVDGCVCGHGREAHAHYRPGADCGLCDAHDCGVFRPVGGHIRRCLRLVLAR